MAPHSRNTHRYSRTLTRHSGPQAPRTHLPANNPARVKNNGMRSDDITRFAWLQPCTCAPAPSSQFVAWNRATSVIAIPRPVSTQVTRTFAAPEDGAGAGLVMRRV